MIWSSKEWGLFKVHFLVKSFKVKMVLVLAWCIAITGSVFCFGHSYINEKNTLRNIVFGNSITAERVTVDRVFAQRLPGLLKDSRIDVDVLNSDLQGRYPDSIMDHDLFKIKHDRDQFESDVLFYHPDVVLIGVDTKDLYIDIKPKKVNYQLFQEYEKKRLIEL